MFNESDNTYDYTNSPSGDESGQHTQSQPPRFPWDYDQVRRYEPMDVPAPPKKKKGSRTAGKVIALVLCCSLLSAALGAGGALLTTELLDWDDAPAKQQGSNISGMLEGNRENSVIDITQIDTSKLQTPAQVYAANVNSTVGITTSITTNYWGYQTTSAASGSGFILSDDGYILTNYHVIESSDSITVSLYDGTSYDAALIGYDESNDIAVLKVDAKNLSPVILGNSDNMNVGDSVVAIGNPLGELPFSLTSGSISAMNRQVTLSTGVTMNLMQTDCAINSGNSGGALFNLYGEVIGITNAKYSGSSSSGASIDNIAFAIPINHVWNLVQSIIEKGYISKPYIGISVNSVSSEAQRYGLPQGAAGGSIAEDSAAQAAGLKVNDIITHINGTAITGSNDLVTLVGQAQVGSELKLTVYRQGASSELTVTVGEQIQSALEENKQPTQSGGSFPWGQ